MTVDIGSQKNCLGYPVGINDLDIFSEPPVHPISGKLSSDDKILREIVLGQIARQPQHALVDRIPIQTMQQQID
jgi:hypothetical protein